MRTWIKAAVGTTLFAVLAVGVIGWMHTPGARPWLGKLGMKCPVMTTAKASDIDKARRKQLAAAPDALAAPARPAFGLALDQAVMKDGKAWAEQRGLTCKQTKRGYDYLECTKVAPSAIGEMYTQAPIDRLILTFGSKGTLIGVQTYRPGVSPDVAVEVLKGGGKELAAELGPPTTVTGDATGPEFRKPGFATAQVNYRFKDYLATLEAANLPGSGVVVMEKFYSTTL